MRVTSDLYPGDTKHGNKKEERSRGLGGNDNFLHLYDFC